MVVEHRNVQEVEREYYLEGYVITVRYADRHVSIRESAALTPFFAVDLQLRAGVLLNRIKEDYMHHLGKPLQIRDESLLLEILAHLYAGDVARALRHRTNIKFIHKITDLVIERADHIDCGEGDVDKNRWLWDLLSRLNPLLLKMYIAFA